MMSSGFTEVLCSGGGGGGGDKKNADVMSDDQLHK